MSLSSLSSCVAKIAQRHHTVPSVNVASTGWTTSHASAVVLAQHVDASTNATKKTAYERRSPKGIHRSASVSGVKR